MDVITHVFLMNPQAGFLGKREGYKIPGGK
jgi:hypothetical protein